MTRGCRTAAALLVLAVLTGCSIPVDDSARDLAAELPDVLLPAASTTTEAPAMTETVQIYLARGAGDDLSLIHI